MSGGLSRWAWGSRVVHALYQGMPMVAVHRALSTVGIRGTIGRELQDFARLDGLSSVVPRDEGQGPRVLFVIPRNFRTHATFQAGLALALTLRGGRCAIATCGGIMPVCEVTWAERETFPRCARCTAYVTDLCELLRIPLYRLADFRNVEEDAKLKDELVALGVEGLKKFVWKGLAIGPFAIPPTRWRLRSHHIADHQDGPSVLSGFIRGGMQWAVAVERVIDEFRPDVVLMLNGLFMEERITWAVAQRKGCRCVFFERGRDAGTVFLSHEVSAPRYDITGSWTSVKDTPLTDGQRTTIMNVMERRFRGERMVETYWSAKESRERNIAEHLSLGDERRPLAVLFTNVGWDTAMQDRDVAFDGMMDWLGEVLAIFSRHPDWQLVIRVHPAETQVPGRESFDRVTDWVNRQDGTLSKNVRVVQPEEPIDSYALMNMATVGCVYASTVGLEMAVKGTPVIVAGAAHYGGKGFTYDISSRRDFEATLVSLMNKERAIPRERQIELALRYAYLFFLRRTLPMAVLREPKEARPRLAFNHLDELRPGRHLALDIMCDGILKRTEFELPLASC